MNSNREDIKNIYRVNIINNNYTTILSQLFEQSHVVNKIIDPILKDLCNNENRIGVESQINATKHLLTQIPHIVFESIKQNPSVSQIPLRYMNIDYKIHLEYNTEHIKYLNSTYTVYSTLSRIL